MKGLTGRQQTGSGEGFTLVEVLLALVLVMILLGAMVFSFSNLQQGAQLDEGVAQVEHLLKFARAHAANIGRQVQLRTEEEYDLDFYIPSGNLLLDWEPDPLGQPGSLEKVTEAESFLQSINELVQIETVRVVDPVNPDSPAPPAEGSPGDPEGVGSSATALSAVTFYPDGSSDSAEIILSSRSAEDPRRMAIRLSGITGSIRRVLLTTANDRAEASESPDRMDQPKTGVVEPP